MQHFYSLKLKPTTYCRIIEPHPPSILRSISFTNSIKFFIFHYSLAFSNFRMYIFPSRHHFPPSPPRCHHIEKAPTVSSPCAGAKELWKCSACDYRRTETGRVSAERKTARHEMPPTKEKPFSKLRTRAPSLSECRSEHAFHSPPTAPAHGEETGGAFSSPFSSPTK